MNRQAFAVTAVLASCLAPLVHADDWPEFRGPTGQGLVIKGELPTTWSKDKNIAWKQSIPGKGWSSPVVVGGRVYLTTAVPVKGSEDLALEALCVDAANGAILWEKEVFRQDGKKSPRIHGKNSHASPTPLVREGRLFVHFGHQGTACLDLKGEVLWKNASLHYAPVHGNGGSPILVEDLLVFSCDGGDTRFVVALDVADGRVRWKTKRTTPADKNFSFGTPLLIEVDGRKQIVSSGSDVVAAYDPADGKEIWRVRYSGYSVIPRPVYGHGLLFICTGYDRPGMLAIRAGGKGDVTDTRVVWKTNKAAPHAPSPLLIGDELYTVSDSGQACCRDARTGEIHWQERLGGTYSASPLCAGGKIYFQSEQGTGVVVRAGKEFKVLANNVLGERSLASPAAADGALFLRTEKHLYRIGALSRGHPVMSNAILRVRCADRTGIIAALSDFVFRHGGNILDLDQHSEAESGQFFMRLVWSAHNFNLDADGIRLALEVLARGFGLHWELNFEHVRDRVAVFCSKQPHCLYDLLLRQRLGELAGDIVLVVSNHPDARPSAEYFGLPFVVVPVTAETKAEAEARQQALLQEHRIDSVVLARYMQVLSPAFVERWRGRVINIHHSFLPAFAGARPYHQAQARGVKLIGATAHYATAELDEGPIIEQDVVRVTHRDTVEDMVRKGRDLERQVLARAVRLHLDRRVLVEGKRTIVFG